MKWGGRGDLWTVAHVPTTLHSLHLHYREIIRKLLSTEVFLQNFTVSFSKCESTFSVRMIDNEIMNVIIRLRPTRLLYCPPLPRKLPHSNLWQFEMLRDRYLPSRFVLHVRRRLILFPPLHPTCSSINTPTPWRHDENFTFMSRSAVTKCNDKVLVSVRVIVINWCNGQQGRIVRGQGRVMICAVRRRNWFGESDVFSLYGKGDGEGVCLIIEALFN